MTHDAPDAALVEQVVWPALTENRLALVPVMVSPVMVSVEASVFVSVSSNVAVGCGWIRLIFKLPKSSAAGTSLTTPATSVMVALADFVLSVAEVAVIVTLAGFGTAAGAAYIVDVPLAVVVGMMVPQTAAGHAVPFCVSVQLTLTCALESFFTVATDGVELSATVAPIGMNALGQVAVQLGSLQIPTFTVMAGTLITIEPVWFGSESEVATSVTCTSLAGGLAGAL